VPPPPAGLEDELQRLRRRVKQLEADARQQAPGEGGPCRLGVGIVGPILHEERQIVETVGFFRGSVADEFQVKF